MFIIQNLLCLNKSSQIVHKKKHENALFIFIYI